MILRTDFCNDGIDLGIVPKKIAKILFRKFEIFVTKEKDLKFVEELKSMVTKKKHEDVLTYYERLLKQSVL